MKKTAVLLIALGALMVPASALAAPQLAAPLPGGHAASSTTTTPTTTTPTTTAPTPTPTPAPLDIAADRAALTAYAAYLTTLLKAVPTGQANDTSYIATIAAGTDGCKGALQPLTQPSVQPDVAVQHTLMVLGKEMGDDLAISFDQAALPAFTKFATGLQKLHWTRLTGAPLAVRHYVAAETAVLVMVPSALCQDSLYAATTPRMVPVGTRTFVKGYEKASTLADAAQANLLKIMQLYEGPKEKSLVSRIAGLAAEVSSLTKADLLQSGTTLATALENT